MTHDAIIEKVKKKYASADEATIHAVLQTLQDAKVELRWPDLLSTQEVAKKPTTPFKPPLKFVGEHLTLEEYRKLSLKERSAHKRQLKQQNREWLEKAFSSLRAAWIMVMNGEIIAHGLSLKDYPSTEKIREIGARYRKRPFLFVNDLFVAIEESNAAWHPTIHAEDFYPTVPLALRSESGVVEITADFDTGAASSFADYDMLLSHKIFKSDEDEEGESSEHLGLVFEYFDKSFIVEVKLSSGEIISRNLTLNCVTNWRLSPFVNINPRRTALAGRDLFLELQPGIFLDFANRRTTISVPPTT